MARASRKPDLSKRIRSFGPIRIAIVVAGMVATWVAFALAVAGVTRNYAPDLALKFVPFEAIALAVRADQLQSSETMDQPASVRTMAQDALRHQALNPRALRVLGYYHGATGRPDLVAGFIRLADRQTRRDPVAQLWLIEDAVRQNDVRLALRRYDTVFRVEPSTYVPLFPVLLSAIDDPVIRAELVPYVRNDRGWIPSFLTHAIAGSSNLPALVDLVVASGGLGSGKDSADQLRALLERLVGERQFAQARRLFVRMPGATPARLTDARLAASDRSGTFGALGWQVRSETDFGSAFANGEGDRTSLSIYANVGTTGVVASRLLYLPPGQHDFAAWMSVEVGGDVGRVRWQLRCAVQAAAEPLWSLEARAPASKGRPTIPRGCPVQSLELVASAGPSEGLEAAISDVSIHPRR